VLREITKTSDAIRKKYNTLREKSHVTGKVVNDMWKSIVTPLKRWVEQETAQGSDDQTADPERQ